MFNLLRMDLYRLKRSKSVYICLAILLAATVLCYWMLWMLETPEGRSFASRIGMAALTGPDDGPILTAEANTLDIFREIGMDGGAYSCLLGIVVALFVCADFSSGFAKNILSLHRNRWKYIGSKLIAVGILNFIYIIVLFGFSLLTNILFHTLFPFSGIGDTLFYLTWCWLLTTAFAALTILICTFTRSNSASITATFLLSSGILVTALSYVTGLFRANGWMQYTLYFNITYGSSSYKGIHDLQVYAVGLVFLILYSVAGAVTLSRKDI